MASEDYAGFIEHLAEEAAAENAEETSDYSKTAWFLGKKDPRRTIKFSGVMVRAASLNLYERTLTRTWW